MKKTTIYLPDRTKAAIERRARRTGTSEAEVIRAALEAALAGDVADEDGELRFGFLSFPPIADRVDEILAEGFGDWRVH